MTAQHYECKQGEQHQGMAALGASARGATEMHAMSTQLAHNDIKLVSQKGCKK